MTVAAPNILCIGSVLWDHIGRTDLPMVAGNDKPGRITRLPGGVALNIAMTLKRAGMTPAILSVVGRDALGQALIIACEELGLITDHILVDPHLPTDQYMAIEAKGKLIAAIADAHSLEAAGARILAPLYDGRLGTAEAFWPHPIAIDGNLTRALLGEIAVDHAFLGADLRLAPASPGKAERLRVFLGHPRACFYVNCEEAQLISGRKVAGSEAAAAAMIKAGAARVLVTDGSEPAMDADRSGGLVCRPPQVTPRRITGAGDTFMATHIAAEMAGVPRQAALRQAVAEAAAYVSGEKRPWAG